MSDQKEELRAKLVAQAEAAIDKMLSDERLTERMTLSDIEAVVGLSEADFRQRALEEIITIQQDRPVTCSMYGGKLHNKGKRKKRVVTLRGETQIERSYYQCADCGQGYFPPRCALHGCCGHKGGFQACLVATGGATTTANCPLPKHGC
jgi:hypothetical protein